MKNPSNICIDVRYYSQKPSGVGRYIKNLVENLLSLPDKNIKYFLLGTNKNFEYLNLTSNNYIKLIAPFDAESHPLSDIWYNTFFIKLLKKHGINLYHASSFMVPFVKTPCPMITTIFDRVASAYPETIPLKFRLFLNFNVKTAVKNSSGIITISNFIKTELTKEFPEIPPVKAIHLGFNKKENEKIFSEDKTPFFLVAGNIEPRKGIIETIKAFEIFKDKHPGIKIKLVFAGQTLWNYKEPAQTAANSKYSDSIVFKGYVSDAELRNLYHSARINIIPSLYEGFGLTLLEAMSASAPILINEIPVFNEIAGDFTYKADVRNPQTFAEKISEIYNIKTDTNKLRVQYDSHLSNFSWEKCAQQTRNVYEECIK